MEIMLGKLTSGEVVIGKLTDTGMDDCLMVLNRQNGNRIETMITPMFMMMSKDTVFIKNEHIIAPATPTEELKNEYIKHTSDIILPSSNIRRG